MIQRNDALVGGLNADLSNSHTLIRRPGMPRYCSQGFASNEFPLTFFSARINGQVIDFVDTTLAVYTFTPTTLTLLFTKSAGAGQTFFQQIGNKLYFSNGVDNKKWCPPAQAWAATTLFALGALIIDTNGNVQQVTTAGTSGGSQPAWNTTPITGNTTDGGITWANRGNQVSNWGTASAAANTPTITNATAAAAGTSFWSPLTTYHIAVIILDSNGNLQFTSGSLTEVSGATVPVWNTVINSLTKDGTVKWMNLGPLGTWIAGNPYTTPGISQGPVILDSNANLQQVTTGGTSGTTTPSWATTIGNSTTDGTVQWICRGPGTIVAASGYQWVYAPHTCYGHVGTASNASLTTGTILASSFSIPIGGTGFADPQVDAIWVFRTNDGGGIFEFAFSVPNPGNTTWTFNDTLADDSLNEDILAPLDDSNDPPPVGLTVVKYYMRRMWGAFGNFMVYGLGPDSITGVAEESWPPANFETYAAPVQTLVPSSQGILTFTNDQMWVEQGGPQTLSFFPTLVLDNFGVSSPNCIAQNADQLYLYTSSRQFFSMSLGSGKNEDGFAVGNLFLIGNPGFPPASSYVALHTNGTDIGVFLGDGSTNYLRYSLNSDSWSTLCTPAGGIGALRSIETSAGTYGLMAGRATGSGFILQRDITKFFDDISDTYVWNAVIGSLVVSQPGMKTEAIEAFVIQQTIAGTRLSVGVLANEIAGTFVDVPYTCDDPADISQTDFALKSLRQPRYDWKGIQEQLPNSIRHIQVQISGLAENAASEVLGLHLCPQVEG
ncbi:MAG TPA: hypothetical protein VHA06_09080, partial [Candidatus Angelobacter sp.]|nr:hypothetical protein [Candidatus Angelobacter sp.]